MNSFFLLSFFRSRGFRKSYGNRLLLTAPFFHQFSDVLGNSLLAATSTKWHDYFFLVERLLVFPAARKSAAVGAPFEPGLRILSLEPAAILARFFLILAQSPGLFAMIVA